MSAFLPPLQPQLSTAQALQAILARAMDTMGAQATALAQGVEPESVHQMRVALRAWRAALRLFRARVACPPGVEADLRWLAASLGGARDWDVLAGTTLAGLIQAHPGQPGWAPLQQAAQQHAGQLRQLAAQAVRTERFAQLMAGMHALADSVAQEGSNQSVSPAHALLSEPWAVWAAPTLARWRHRLLKQGQALEKQTPAERHRVRIAAKRLRYATVLCQPLWPGGRRQAHFVAALAEVQEALGQLHDLSVAQALLAQLAQEHSELATAARQAVGWIVKDEAKRLRRLHQPWQQFREARVPWSE